jgi:UDP-N-acetyl-D-glucosamine dehydrogenase
VIPGREPPERREQSVELCRSCHDLEEHLMKDTAGLRRRILARSAPVAVVGQGYVGLTAACAAATAGFDVVGIDVDHERVRDLEQGILSVPSVSEVDFRTALDSARISFSAEPARIADAEIVLICVPTPLRDHAPDLSHVEQAARDVATRLEGTRLVILESTTYPGTTDQLVRPILESTGLAAGRDFLLAYSPERIDPGNGKFGFRDTPRIVGGIAPEATGVARLFYQQLVDEVYVVSSCRAAELAKLLENTFRHVNIALVNEMAMLCNEMNIDVWEVVEAAATKPFGFMPFYPGPGVGGHCIPLDPTYLAWQVRRDSGHQFRILEQAQDINAQMPAYVASRIGDALNEIGKAVKGAHILVLGVTYKPDVGDIRESPALQLMAALNRRGARLSFHDPFVEEISLNGSIIRRTQLNLRAIREADCVALITPHRGYDLDWVARHSTLVFDARNAYGETRDSKVVRL